MLLRPKELGILFAVGAVGGLVGDAAAVQADTTRYIDDSLPFIWESPVWFPLLVGLAAAAIGLLRLQLGAPRQGYDIRAAVGAGAAVVAIYSITSLAGDDGTAAVALVASLALLTAAVLADRPALVCGLAAAVVGPTVEIAIVGLDLSLYTEPNDGLFGVGLWLPPLYFAFGVAVARISEVLVAGRRYG